MHGLLNAKCVVGFLLAASVASCSLLIGTGERQCKTNADCVSAQLGALCLDQVCTDGNTCQGPACMASEAVLPSDGKCTTDKQCGRSAPRCLKETCVTMEVAERWMCAVEEQSIKTSTVRYGFHIVDFLTGVPPKNIMVNACRNNDVACTKPVDTFVDKAGTGQAVFDLPTGFFGFFEVRSDAMPVLLYVTKPINKNGSNRDLPVLTASTVQLTALAVGLNFDPSKGLALLEAIDCAHVPAGGIHFTMTGANGQAFYLVDQAPSRDAMLTVYEESNNSANGGFVNVDVGFVEFQAFLGAGGLQLGSFNAQIRASTITFIDLEF